VAGAQFCTVDSGIWKKAILLMGMKLWSRLSIPISCLLVSCMQLSDIGSFLGCYMGFIVPAPVFSFSPSIYIYIFFELVDN
jgi:hypothetical protein